MSNGTGTVYALIDPRDDVVRYVGQTTKPLAERLAGHVATQVPRVKEWIDQLRDLGNVPRIVALARDVPVAELRARERAEITQRLADGQALLNASATAAGREQAELRARRQREELERAAWEEMAHNVRALVGGPLPPGDLPPVQLSQAAMGLYERVLAIQPVDKVGNGPAEGLSLKTRTTLAHIDASDRLWQDVRGLWGALRGWAGCRFDDVMEARIGSAVTGPWANGPDLPRYVSLVPWSIVALPPWAALAERAGIASRGQGFIDWVTDDAEVREALELLLLTEGGRVGSLSALDSTSDALRPSTALVAMTAAHCDLEVPEVLQREVAAALTEMARCGQLTKSMAVLLRRMNPGALDEAFGPDLAGRVDEALGLPAGTASDVLRELVGLGHWQYGRLDRVIARATQEFETVEVPDFGRWGFSGDAAPLVQSVVTSIASAGAMGLPADHVERLVAEMRSAWTPTLVPD